MPVPPCKYARFEYGGLPVKSAIFVIVLFCNAFRPCSCVHAVRLPVAGSLATQAVAGLSVLAATGDRTVRAARLLPCHRDREPVLGFDEVVLAVVADVDLYPVDLSQIALVTGATAGIGLQSARMQLQH